MCLPCPLWRRSAVCVLENLAKKEKTNRQVRWILFSSYHRCCVIQVCTWDAVQCWTAQHAKLSKQAALWLVLGINQGCCGQSCEQFLMSAERTPLFGSHNCIHCARVSITEQRSVKWGYHQIRLYYYFSFRCKKERKKADVKKNTSVHSVVLYNHRWCLSETTAAVWTWNLGLQMPEKILSETFCSSFPFRSSDDDKLTSTEARGDFEYRSSSPAIVPRTTAHSMREVNDYLWGTLGSCSHSVCGWLPCLSHKTHIITLIHNFAAEAISPLSLVVKEIVAFSRLAHLSWIELNCQGNCGFFTTCTSFMYRIELKCQLSVSFEQLNLLRVFCL